jgi:hypothetical protein
LVASAADIVVTAAVQAATSTLGMPSPQLPPSTLCFDILYQPRLPASATRLPRAWRCLDLFFSDIPVFFRRYSSDSFIYKLTPSPRPITRSPCRSLGSTPHYPGSAVTQQGPLGLLRQLIILLDYPPRLMMTMMMGTF